MSQVVAAQANFEGANFKNSVADCICLCFDTRIAIVSDLPAGAVLSAEPLAGRITRFVLLTSTAGPHGPHESQFEECCLTWKSGRVCQAGSSSLRGPSKRSSSKAIFKNAMLTTPCTQPSPTSESSRSAVFGRSSFEEANVEGADFTDVTPACSWSALFPKLRSSAVTRPSWTVKASGCCAPTRQ